MTTPKPLSPAAQSVLDAFTEDNSLHDWKHNHYNTEALAAALRAVANDWRGEIGPLPVTERTLCINDCADCLCEIAEELEGQP